MRDAATSIISSKIWRIWLVVKNASNPIGPFLERNSMDKQFLQVGKVREEKVNEGSKLMN